MGKCANCGAEVEEGRNWCKPCVHRLVAENALQYLGVKLELK